MNIMAFETAGEFCSVALWTAAGCVARHHEESPARHTARLLPACELLCAEAGVALSALDAVAFGRGPGAFTGVRVAASAARGIALALSRPLLGISSLAALARAGWRRTGVARQLAVLDARRGEIYWGAYTFDADGDAHAADGPDRVGPPESLHLPEGLPWSGIGAGLALLPARLGLERPELPRTAHFPAAEDVAALAAHWLSSGRTIPAEQALPLYLREAVQAVPGRV